MQCMCSLLLVLLLGHHEPPDTEEAQFHLRCFLPLIPDVWKSQILELIVLTFIKDYTAPGSALVIFKAYYKAHEKQEA